MPLRRPTLILALLLAAIPATMHARDRVGAFTTFKIAAGNDANDVVCAFCTITIEGPIHGDLVTAFSDVTVADNTEIGKDTVTAFTDLHFGENVTIGKDLVAFGSFGDLPASTVVHGDRVVVPAWLAFLFALIPFAIPAGIIYLIVRLVRGRQTYAYVPPPGYPRV
ncbi:hypothetical protein [Terriglobus saanensis]|uniref:Transmembrane protein n=1 Tax=Terriglobus saanensis (strain ATCC BAA-1853 / DSM 23119 / SP1PR4) TaxID=401053 RepID=E8V3U8_TERSS|nr:hypothetical protein [Terriglobus saanensis]ADV81362.1 hypothetical protein AciPR4_0527 [Terriglobus saanensis SP1PR4]